MRRVRWVLVPLLVLVPVAVAFATATLSVTPRSLSFATQCTHSSAPAKHVVVANDGDTAATDVTVSVSPSAMATVFPLGGQTSSSQLDSGSSMQVQVGFVPEHVGTSSASAIVTYVDPGTTPSPDPSHHGPSPTPTPETRTSSIPLSGNAIDRFIDASPPGVNFGSIHTGKKGPERTLTIFDDGDTPLTIQGVSLGGRQPGDFSLGTISSSIVTDGHPATLTMGFRPRGVGARAAELTIRSDSCTSPSLTVQLAGIAVEQDIVAKPPKVDFGTAFLGTTPTKLLTIANQGGAPLKLSTMTLVNEDPTTDDLKSFTVTGLPKKFPRVLQAGQSIQLTVRFNAAETGPKKIDLKVGSDDRDTKLLTVQIFAAAEVKPTPSPTLSVVAPPPSKPSGAGFHLHLGPYIPTVGVALGVAAFFVMLVAVRRRRGIPE